MQFIRSFQFRDDGSLAEDPIVLVLQRAASTSTPRRGFDALDGRYCPRKFPPASSAAAVLRSHWNVVILCNLGTEDGRIIILDSLIDIGLPSQQEPWIRRILLDVYKEAERPEDEEFIYNIPLHVPHMPQQKNAHECGVYALYFIFLLVRRGLGIFLPEKQNNNECHDWFWIEEYYSSNQTYLVRNLRFHDSDVGVEVDAAI
ncbi:hypothetical protein ZIOFF_056824 [Zingiber officinale]|uniref:Ubiquitin-like protease family profile domain-containing protein n=1 Tax=Zingiber officinale TaxID=94328 RepID=A0A8J5FYJ9_ZINOF|nr:hypothetical protein ZIOFF_056824 [Zingiber officinale]